MRERTVTLSSAGKLFSLTGWRVAWVVGPSRLVTPVSYAHTHLTYCAPTPLQVHPTCIFFSPLCPLLSNLHYVWSWRLDCTWATLVALACVWVAFVHVLALLSLCPPAQMLSDVWGCCRGLFVGVQLALSEMNRCAAACMWSCMYVELPLSESRGWTRSTSRWVSQRQCERRTAALVV
jgi:hypothetical protein